MVTEDPMGGDLAVYEVSITFPGTREAIYTFYTLDSPTMVRFI